MQNFISTETITLLSTLYKIMPNLFGHIIQYSTTLGKKSSSSSTTAPSRQQIQEARLHPSTIISQALIAITAIQKALNITNNRLGELTKQRQALEKELTALLSADDQDTTKPADEDKTALLQKQLIALKETEKKLNSIADELQQKFRNLDQILSKQAAAWNKHSEEYFNTVSEQLEKSGISLTTEEKNRLRQVVSTDSSIIEARADLKKLGIDVSDKISDFTIATYAAVVATMSHSLQKIDNASVKDVIKKLSAVKTLDDTTKNIVEEFKKYRTEIEQDCEKLTKEATGLTLTLTPDVRPQLTSSTVFKPTSS
ncbi:MAG: hypothetical protein ACD_69C00089G0002 [uncultured bacterium]|nr:MAG: hypothetical protein ACD_69C00089G0002 [uncultured bacterium]HBY56010.1 hypothetical protein [Coxiellaceae bacterium]